MEASIINYFLKVSVAMTIFYVVYQLLFRKDTFIALKRFYLLFSLILSALIPFVTIHLADEKPTQIPVAWLSEITIHPNSAPQSEVTSIHWQAVVLGVMLIISAVLILRFVLQIFEIYRLKYRNLSKKQDAYTLILLQGDKISPFSFFKWIFVDKEAWQDDNNEIIQHERIHASQWHSADVMFSELICIIFWWNPIAWLYRREIRVNHEFLADRGVLHQGFNPQNYQYALLQTMTVTNRIPINNYFNISQLKKRIAMMNKQPSPRQSAAKYLLVLPLAGLLIAGNAVKASPLKTFEELTSEPQSKQKNKNSKEVVVTAVSDESKAVGKSEVMPQYPGGEKAMMEYLAANIKYPEKAAKENVSGRIIVRFIVSKTGKIEDVKVIKGVSPECDAEAIRVVKAMPDWTPGKSNGKLVSVYYTMPIIFSLGNEKVEVEKMPFQNSVVYVDGKAISSEELKKIDPQKIESMNILKGDAAVKKYGDAVKEKTGAIEIILKK